MTSKGKGPNSYQAITSITWQNRSLGLGHFVSLPQDNADAGLFWNINLRYDLKHRYAFNQAIEVVFKAKSTASSSILPKFSIFFPEGKVTNLEIEHKPDAAYVKKYFPNLHRSDRPANELAGIETSRKNDNLMVISMGIKLRDLVNNYFWPANLIAGTAARIFFEQTCRQSQNLDELVTFDFLVKVGDKNLQSHNFRDVMAAFEKQNKASLGNGDIKAKSFYKMKPFTTSIHNIHDVENRSDHDPEVIFPYPATAGADNTTPLNDEQYFAVRAIAQADTQSAEIKALKAAKTIEIPLRIIRHGSDPEFYWEAATVLPADYPVRLVDYPEMMIRWYGSSSASWQGRVISRPNSRQGLRSDMVFLKIEPKEGDNSLPPSFTIISQDDLTTALAALTLAANPKSRAYFEFELLPADFRRRQASLSTLNPFEEKHNAAAVARWKDFHLETNIAGLRRTESWFGPAFAAQYNNVAQRAQWNNTMGRLLGMATFSFTPEQWAVVGSFLNASHLVHNIHGLAGTAKSTTVAFIIGAAAAAPLNFRFVMVAAENFTLNNAIADMSEIICTLSSRKVFRWYSRKDMKTFLEWAIRGKPKYRQYSHLALQNPQHLTDLEHLQLAWAKSFDAAHDAGGRFRVPQYNPVFFILNINNINQSIKDCEYHRPSGFAASLAARAQTIQGPEIGDAATYAARRLQDPELPERYTEDKVRKLLAETELRENALNLHSTSTVDRVGSQIMTILLRPRHDSTYVLDAVDHREIDRRLDYICSVALRDSAVVFATPFRLHDECLQKNFKWHVAVIEEAEAVNIDNTDVVIAARPAARLVLVGDLQQPPPFYKESKSKSTVILKQSVLQKSIFMGLTTVTLTINFRGVKPIIDFISQSYYHGELRAGLGNTRPASSKFAAYIRQTFNKNDATVAEFPILFVETPNTAESKSGTSKVNAAAVKSVRAISNGLLRCGIPMEDQIILSAYLAQVNEYRINSGHSNSNEFSNETNTSRAMTITSVKGHAAEVIILDLTRTESWGFVLECNKLEEALTRAQAGIIVVGNITALLKDYPTSRPKFDKLLSACKKMYGKSATNQIGQNMMARL